MENQIFRVDNTFAKSVVLKENELWIHSENVSSLEKFEKAVNKTGMLQSAYSILLSSITEVSYNELSEGIKIKYENDKGKEKKLNLNFEDTALSNNFGQFLGDKMEFKKSIQQESQVTPLLLNTLYLLIAVGMTFYVGMMEDTSSLTDTNTRRGRGMLVIFKMIVDTIGQVGVFIIGGLVSIYLAYQLYKRYKNPSNEILYTR